MVLTMRGTEVSTVGIIEKDKKRKGTNLGLITQSPELNDIRQECSGELRASDGLRTFPDRNSPRFSHVGSTKLDCPADKLDLAQQSCSIS